MRKAAFKLLYILNIHKILHYYIKKNQFGIILCFHRVSDEKNLMFPPLQKRVFESIIEYISKNFYSCSTQEFFDEKLKNENPKILITFDDGYKDFIENALPILVKYNIKALHNIIVDSAEKNIYPWTQELNNIINHLYTTKKFGKYKLSSFELIISENEKKTYNSGMEFYKIMLSKNKSEREKILNQLNKLTPTLKKEKLMMNWEDIIKCNEQLIEIGSHTYTHDSLKTIKEDKLLDYEISFSKQKIEEKINIKIDSIAFPNGEYSNKIVTKSIKSGYSYLFTTKEKIINLSNYDNLIPRISIYHNDFHESIFKLYNFHKLFNNEKK